MENPKKTPVVAQPKYDGWDPLFNKGFHDTPRPPGTLFDPDAPESFDGTPAAGKKDP